jgi:uncharacterized membrane protein YraQ (UPF0718 family)
VRIEVKKENHEKRPEKKNIFRIWLFPAVVIIIYGVLFFFSPDTVLAALGSSGNVFVKVLLPLSLVFILMLALNIFLKPGHIVRYIGKGAGIRGVFLSVMAGIISMGPIYAWYPLLKGLREKGAEASLIAIFLGNRAVKPFLLPVMISYLGWAYTLLLTVLTCLGSLVAGYTVSLLEKAREPR